jgi:uncharacterized membrane protein YkoI
MRYMLWTQSHRRTVSLSTPNSPTLLAAAMALMALLSAGPYAKGPDDAGADLARRLLAEGAILPLEVFIDRARELRTGSLIDAELHFEREHGVYVYEIHLLDATGAVWEMEFNAATGLLIEHEPYEH